MTFQEDVRPISSGESGGESTSESTVWDDVPSDVTGGDPRFAPGRRPAPWLFTPSEVEKKKRAQVGLSNGIFDGRF